MYKYNTLTPQTLAILRDKATEPPFTDKMEPQFERGSYICRGCGLPLYPAEAWFNSGTGWPSFDSALDDHVQTLTDIDGRRTEIICQRCQGHLGHIFYNEGFTARNKRHCVNSLALEWVPNHTLIDTEEAIVAGGCFWGIEHLMKKCLGVIKTQVGYTGGHVDQPDYQQVCHSDTGHLEAVRVIFDPNQQDYVGLLQYFFECHDPTQSHGQGHDIGQQYQSAVFFLNPNQKQKAQQVIKQLKSMGYETVTQLRPASPFWPAEAEHQDFYDKHPQAPLCHQRCRRF